jgi:hypothetical protein
VTDYTTRQALYRKIERNRKSRVIALINGDRPNWETQLSRDFPDHVVDHLDEMPKTETISIILHTNGGDTLAAWRLVHLIRQFCKKLEVLIPLKALSAGTLIALGCDKIVMTKQASLGPIDPSITTPLNPTIPGAGPNARAPVSVEAIKGYLEIATRELAIKDDAAMATIFTALSAQVHPIVLGQVFRARTQIQFLARRLLKHQVTDAEKIDSIISFLCSESGSHDYTIDRHEGRELGLEIETPDDTLYSLMRDVHKSYRTELQLNDPYDPSALLTISSPATYAFKRCLIESVDGGCNSFMSEGSLALQNQPAPGVFPPVMQDQIMDKRDFEGWRKLA